MFGIELFMPVIWVGLLFVALVVVLTVLILKEYI